MKQKLGKHEHFSQCWEALWSSEQSILIFYINHLNLGMSSKIAKFGDATKLIMMMKLKAYRKGLLTRLDEWIT